MLKTKQHVYRVQPFISKMGSIPVMRRGLNLYTFIVVSITVMLLSSCQKQGVSDPPMLNSAQSGESSASATGSTAPMANAGLNRVVIAPASTAVLSGSGSDAGGLVTYQWKQTKGPTVAVIAQPTKPETGLSNLKLGVYRFVLTVTNSNKVSSTDTTVVSVMERFTIMVDGIARTATVHRPTGNKGAPPVLMIFHGYGGSDTDFATKKAFEDYWEDAIVVYPLGLLSRGRDHKVCNKTGWQISVGEVNCNDGQVDQDLKFFDAMLPKLKSRYNANLNLVFAHGFSGGGDFVYNALWPGRGEKLAALAPAGSILDSVYGTKGKMPKPLMHVGGTNDKGIPFDSQQQSVAEIRALNQCSPTGTVWDKGTGGLLGTRWESPINDPVVFLQYNGPHKYPPEVTPQIVRFFKEVTAQITGTAVK